MRLLRRIPAARAVATLAVALAVAACREGTEPASLEPQGIIVASKADTIVTMNIDGTGQRRVGGVPAITQYGQHPGWLTREHVVVHTSTSAAGVRLHSLNLQTGALARLTPTTSPLAAEWYPRWSGGWVYFMGETTAGTFETWRVRANGAELAKVPATNPDFGNYYRPVLSPMGSRLAVSTVVNSRIGVTIANATTGAVVGEWVGGATAPRWSPDGTRVAFSTPGGGPIRMMSADGEGLRTIAEGPFEEWFDWTADGQWIVVSTLDGLSVVNVENGAERPIPGTTGMWQPSVVIPPGGIR